MEGGGGIAAAGNAVQCLCNVEDRHRGCRGADGNEAKQAAVLRHSEAILKRDDTVVHEQGGRDKSMCKVKQSFSFWAELLITRDASPNMCQYPSQTSILLRNGKPTWQHLTSTVDVAPPMVELLDG